MTNTKVVKTFTLIAFVALLTSFIAFKTGAFDKYFSSVTDDKILDSGQISNVQPVSVDTPIVKAADTTRQNPAMIYSSKSLIVIEQKQEFPNTPSFYIEDTLKTDSTKQGPRK